jgi:hypothetical protein
MNSKQVRALTPGDQVHWTDPDADLCSKTITIQTIEVCEDEDENDEDHVIFITDTDGGELECNASELTKV